MQDSICSIINKTESKLFKVDDWKKSSESKLSGSGRTRIIENGSLIERGGVNYSHVFGDKLPPTATSQRPELVGRSFEALGISLVFHPKNPYIPTVHMNIRYFIPFVCQINRGWCFTGPTNPQ